jgi:curli biogenesis system outer membrane secretion channel CsgG
MSIFGKIASAIFGSSPAAPATLVSAMPTGIAATDAPAAVASAVSAATPIVTAAAAAATAPAPVTAAAAAKPAVDVAQVLDGISDEQDEELDWRKSIVDLMKLLKLDSSLKSRKELATELKYTGDMGDSASMNVWLHKQVMTKLAENGGMVPDSLKH